MNESTEQMQLVGSGRFLNRIQYLLCQQARVVLGETSVGGTHAARAAYAKNVVLSPASFASVAAVTLIGGPNLIGTVIDVGGEFDSSANDAAILSQIATFWNALAGIDTGN